MPCDVCDGSGWIYEEQYGWVCCAECNDDRGKPTPEVAAWAKSGHVVSTEGKE